MSDPLRKATQTIVAIIGFEVAETKLSLIDREAGCQYSGSAFRLTFYAFFSPHGYLVEMQTKQA